MMRRVGFLLDPERVHDIALRAYARRPGTGCATTPVEVMGLRFPNAVGLAAGYDKDGVAWRGLARLGFGHIEVGTVTARPQAGNPRPRVFRLPSERGLINRMGFPSDGAEAVAARLGTDRPGGVVLGVSIGPNGFHGLDQAAADYELLVDRFAPIADYLAVNVSSPNTPGLRGLESADDLRLLLERIVNRRGASTLSRDTPIPIAVKLSPDIPPADLSEIVEVIAASGVDGLIISNTTTQRPGVTSVETGGLSGAPLGSLSGSVLAAVRAQTSLPIVASGGIMTVTDARERMAAGASLVQVYTGFVFSGPSLVRSIARSVAI
jgi:dihydroorotate dehydrogenase